MGLDENTDIHDMVTLLFLLTMFMPVTSEVRSVYNVLGGKMMGKIFSKSFTEFVIE